MDSMDSERFAKMIDEFDSTIGKNSSSYNDTIMAKALIILRGRELRNEFRKYRCDIKFNSVSTYLLSKFPNAQIDLLEWSLFREGFISKRIIKIFYNVIFYLILISLLTIFGTLIYGLNELSNIDKLRAMLYCILSSWLISYAISKFILRIVSRSSISYFGLGHKRDG